RDDMIRTHSFVPVPAIIAREISFFDDRVAKRPPLLAGEPGRYRADIAPSLYGATRSPPLCECRLSLGDLSRDHRFALGDACGARRFTLGDVSLNDRGELLRGGSGRQ